MFTLKMFLGKEIVWRSHTWRQQRWRGILVGYDRDFFYIRDSSGLEIHSYSVKDENGKNVKDENGYQLYESRPKEVDDVRAHQAYSRHDIVYTQLASEYEWWEKYKLPNPYGLEQWKRAHKRKLIRATLNPEPSLLSRFLSFITWLGSEDE